MDGETFFANLQEFNNKYMEALQLLSNKKVDFLSNPLIDMDNIQKVYIEAVTDFTNNPIKFFEHNLNYASKVANLMFHFMDKMSGAEITPIYEAKNRDRRFKDNAWQSNLYFNFVKQFYLMSADWYRSLVKNLNVNESEKKLLEFYTEQLLNAACPTNYANLNPEVINELVKTNGKNLLQGVENFLNDIKKSDNLLSITTVSSSSFELGKNIAFTEGKILFQNDLMELICYKPKQETFEIPIFIIPPWINKYYILDLSEQNSFIKFLVDRGFQVYLVSWANPSKDFAHKNFEDYLKEGVIEPINFLKNSYGYKKFNLLGYCLGGTLAASALAYYEAKKDPIFSSSTFLTTLLDFSEPGDLGLFINKDTIGAIKQELDKTGFFDGRYMSHAFSLLRANELIWSFVINNYLLGKKPLAFDLLYWNSDTTNLPAAMHSFYLENMYINNALVKPGGIELLGEKIDLSKVNVQSFFLSAIDDHIAPWESTYSGMSFFKDYLKNSVFCLSGSGHIAGVINSPYYKKYNYWVNNDISLSPQEWYNKAKSHEGSWWNYWQEWLQEKSGPLQKSINYEQIDFIEAAPGSYVKVKN